VLPLVFGSRGAAPKSTRVDPTSKMAVVPVQGGDTLQHAVDPVSIPHDVGNEGVATGNDRKLNPQVSVPFPPPALFTDSTRTTLSRWRHGFEPRLDYQVRDYVGALSPSPGDTPGDSHPPRRRSIRIAASR